ERGDREARGALADDDRQALRSLERRHDLGFDLVLPENLPDVLGLALVRSREPDAKALGTPAGDLGGELVEASREARDFLRLQDELHRRLGPGGRARGTR